MSMRKKTVFLTANKYENTKEVYTDGSKSMRKKVCFAAVFTDIIRRGALPEEASIYEAKTITIKISLKQIHK